MTNSRTRFTSHHNAFPICRRQLPFSTNNLNFITITQNSSNGRDIPIHSCARTAITNFGVNRISKVKRCRAFRQSDNSTFRGKTKNLIMEKFHFGIFEKFLCGVSNFQLVDKLLKPFKRLDIFKNFSSIVIAVLVKPVGGDTILSNCVHFRRTNLNFNALPVWANNRGMK